MTIAIHGANEMLKGVRTPWALRLHIGNPGEFGAANLALETRLEEFEWGEYLGGTGRKNKAALEWTEVKAKETYVYFSIWNDITHQAGQMLGFAPFTSPIPVEAGDTFKIPTGLLVFNAE